VSTVSAAQWKDTKERAALALTFLNKY